MPDACGSGFGPVAGSVLVVEDEREIRGLLRRYLERLASAANRRGSEYPRGCYSWPS